MSATFTSLAYNLTTLRERGILKRLRGTPLPTSAYLAGLAGNAVANAALQLAIVILAGHLLLGVAWPRRLGRARGVRRARASSASRSLGVALSHAIPNPESAPAYVNAVFLPQILIAGVFYDARRAPAIIRDIAAGAPAHASRRRALGRDRRRRGRRPTTPSRCSCSALWAAAGLVLAVRGFSWEARAGLALSRVEHVGRAAPAAADAAGGRRRRSPRGCGRDSRIARCGGLASHVRTIAAGVPSEPQP